MTQPRDQRTHASVSEAKTSGATAQTAMQAYTPQENDDPFADEAATDERPTVIITNDGPNTFAEFALPGDTPEEHATEANQAEAETDPHTTNPTGYSTHSPVRVPRPARQLRASNERRPAERPAAIGQTPAAAPGAIVSSGESITARPTPRIASDPNAPEAPTDEDTAIYGASPEASAQAPLLAAALPLAPQQPQQPQAPQPQPAQPAHHIPNLPQPASPWPHQQAQAAPGPHAHHPGRGPAHHGQPQAHYPHQGQPQQPQQPQPHQWAPPPPALMGAPLSPLAAPPHAVASPHLAAQEAPKPSHAPWAVADSWGESTFNGPNTAAGVSYLFGWVSGVIVYFGERRNHYVRFHAAQSVLLTGALTILGVILFTMLQLFGDVAVATHQPAFYHLGQFIALLGLLAIFLSWFIPMVAAWNGHYLRIPVIADYADRYAAPPREIYPDQ